MDPITLITAASHLVPALLRWVNKPDAAALADQAGRVARTLAGVAPGVPSGIADEQAATLAALQAIVQNPALLVQYQQTMNAVVLAQIDADVRALEAINATMRSESGSNDAYVRRARPTFLYAMAGTWAVQMLGLTVVIVLHPEQASPLLNATADMTAMWSMAMAVVGIAVKSRSDDKARALGQDVPGLVGSITQIFKKT